MSRLLELPEELILAIAEYLSYSDLASFIRTCKKSYRITYSVLYSILTPQQKHEVFLWAGYKKREKLMLELLPYILIQKAPVSQYHALASAARCGSAQIIHALVNNGAPLNFNGPELREVVHGFGRPSHEVWRKNLLIWRAAEATYDSHQDSPFAAAARNDDIKTMKLLVQLGADPKQDDDGDHPLHKAARSGNVGLVKALLDLGVEVIRDRDIIGLVEASGGGHHDIMRLLLRANAQTPHPVDSFRDPLLRAATRGDLEGTKILLDAGALDWWICEAAETGDIQAVKTLLAANVRTDEFDPDLGGLLRNTIDGGSVEILQLLVDHGVPLQLFPEIPVESSRETILDYAIAYGSSKVAMFFLDLWPDLNVNYHDTDDMDDTPLSKAAFRGFTDVARALISRNTDVNKAVRESVIGGSPEIVSMLLEAGANFDICIEQLKTQGTPLSWACFLELHEVAAVLLRAGADITYRDTQERTLLMSAVHRNYPHIVDLLLDWNIDLDSVDSSGKTAMDIAIGLQPKAFGWDPVQKIRDAKARRECS
ncbi:ankyrin repeat-containing domain protein [Aspergillus californicus]